MAAVRSLPHFQEKWNEQEEITVIGGLLRIRRGALNVGAHRINDNFQEAAALLSERKLGTQDSCEIAMALLRVLPQDSAQTVLRFVGARPLDYVCR